MPDGVVLGDEDYCYLTTTGRVSGRSREIEIWFALAGDVLYMLSGGRERSNWVRNLVREPAVSVRIGGASFDGRGRVIASGDEEDALARRLLFDKYSRRSSGDLTRWRDCALPVALDLTPAH